MKRILLNSVSFFLVSTNLLAQNFDWASQRDGYWYGKKVFHDKNGDIYVRGNTVDASSGSEGHFYLSNYDSMGTAMWSMDEIPEGKSSVNNNLIYVSSYEGGSYWIKKYDLNGSIIGTTNTGITHSSGFILDIGADTLGNLYLGGFFVGSIAFGSYSFSTPSSPQFFIAKIDTNGNFLWGCASSSSGSGQVTTRLKIDVENESVYVQGEFYGPLNIGDTVINHLGSSNGFVAKFDSDGNFKWVYNVGTYGPGGGQEWINSVSEDSKGNVYGVGYYDRPLIIGSTTLLVGCGSFCWQDAFVFKLDSNGHPIWANRITGPWKEYAEFIKVDQNDQVYVTGSFGDPISLGTVSLSNSGFSEPFLAKYDSTGATIWAVQFSGGGTGLALDVTGDNKILISGSFGGTMDFGGNPLTGTPNSMFITKVSDSGIALSTNTSAPFVLSSSLQADPNPGTGIFTISYTGQIASKLKLEIHNARGQLIWSATENTSVKTFRKAIDLSKEPKGIYFLQVIEDGKKRSVKKIVLN